MSKKNLHIESKRCMIRVMGSKKFLLLHKFFSLPQEVGDKDDNLHPRPKGGEVHRMMISQTGEGKP